MVSLRLVAFSAFVVASFCGSNSMVQGQSVPGMGQNPSDHDSSTQTLSHQPLPIELTGSGPGIVDGPTTKSYSKDPVLQPEDVVVVTKHRMQCLTSGSLDYTATAGLMPLRSATGELEARIFFIAYTLDQPTTAPPRPLMFSFNGGPGSSSVWLHLGALGPRRAVMNPDGSMPAPPFRLEDNPHTWLRHTDLVFIDPVGTGFSRAVKAELNKKFWNVDGDIASVAEFIRLYLGRNNRWDSPLYLVGESYGTTRAAGLSGHLDDKGIALRGVVLVSTVLNFQTIQFGRGNDLPYILFLSTYTATAWYHERLAPELQAQSLPEVLEQARNFANGPYLSMLHKGDRMTTAQAADASRQVAYWTGLDPLFVSRTHLRPNIHHFCKELLRDLNMVVGRFDSRYRGMDASAIGEWPDFDPSYTAVRPPYTALLNHYLRSELKWHSDAEYIILGGVQWEWGRGHTDTSEALRRTLARNPYLRVLIMSGLYDLATPADAAEYTFERMMLHPSQRARVETTTYEAGHMMYLHEPSLVKMGEDISRFLSAPLQQPLEVTVPR